MKIMYFDCFAGIAGDMTLGALVSLGMPFEYLQEQLAQLPVTGYTLEKIQLGRHSIAAVRIDVQTDEGHTHRHLADIAAIIEKAQLPDEVRELSLAIFQRLAEAEAHVHDSSPEKIHFHEVGGLDAIIDIVGSAIGVHYFKPERVYCSPVTLGRGVTKSAHGVIPIPVPATVELLKGFPVQQTDRPGERVTPTGAAIVTTLVERFGGREKIPPYRMLQTGHGAGTKDYEDCPNFLRVILAETTSAPIHDAIEILETNIDDMNPQVIGYLFEKLYAAGAREVYITPVFMKKNRPGSLLTVLCKKDLVEPLSDIIFSETTTAGIRIRSVGRLVLDRRMDTIDTDYGPIRVKLLTVKEGIKIQPEYDDCVRAAETSGVPLTEIMAIARRQAEIKEGLSR
ncbi:MAG: nickel pincer cofactor biosynthesis protein LarC [candidate division Zixibacteria bacterium]|nr:nickel pincer cofactor biosynthesis protein LarC [candidate division Zixibacteria bacterium]